MLEPAPERRRARRGLPLGLKHWGGRYKYYVDFGKHGFAFVRTLAAARADAVRTVKDPVFQSPRACIFRVDGQRKQKIACYARRGRRVVKT